MPSNNILARRANTALSAYVNEAENDFVDDQEALRYLLADIRTLCDAQGWDFGALDKLAYGSYLDTLLDTLDGFSPADANFADPAFDHA